MKFTLSWLRTHLETEASIERIGETLNAIGLEVESIENRADALAPFRIARVIEASPHPNADRLRVCRVDAGEGKVTVVCGAPNARTGMKGVFAAPGSFIPGTGITLKTGEIRGVSSAGMLLSMREMRLGDDHTGIVDLPDDAPVGMPYAQWAGLDDPLIEIGVTPNRGDALSVRGIARDLAAAGLGTLRRWQAPGDRGTVPERHRMGDPDAAGLPVGARPHRAGSAQRRLAGLARGAAGGDRAAADQRARGHHQFLHRRSRPAAACVRRRQGAGRPSGYARGRRARVFAR